MWMVSIKNSTLQSCCRCFGHTEGVMGVGKSEIFDVPIATTSRLFSYQQRPGAASATKTTPTPLESNTPGADSQRWKSQDFKKQITWKNWKAHPNCPKMFGENLQSCCKSQFIFIYYLFPFLHFSIYVFCIEISAFCCLGSWVSCGSVQTWRCIHPQTCRRRCHHGGRKISQVSKVCRSRFIIGDPFRAPWPGYIRCQYRCSMV